MATNWHKCVKTSIVWPVIVGATTLILGVGTFGVWASTAPIASAIIAPAKVAATGRNRVVQHLEGGIIKTVLVNEGDRVEAGQPLVELDTTAATSEVNRLRLQLVTMRAMEARALAERDDAAIVTFPEHLLAAAGAAQLLSDQEAEFASRLKKHQAELAILEQQIAALNEQIAGQEAEKAQVLRQKQLVVEERTALEELLEGGLAKKSQVLLLLRTEAELGGREGQLTAAIAEAKQSIAQIEERRAQAQSTRIGDASAQLTDLRFRIAETAEQLDTAEDVSTRKIIRAPATGVVNDLAQLGTGSVIAPGDKITSIVPDGEGLTIEARVRAQDIDEVKLGQSAWINFPAFDAKKSPPVAAKVTYVSADRFENERTGEVYYLARLAIDDEQAEGFEAETVRPGLEAEVFIATGEQTFFEYAASPLIRSFDRSFRES